MAAARAFAAQSQCFTSTIGQCGPWRFVSTGDGYTSQTLFFDDRGTTVAAVAGTDAIVPGDPCGSSRHYGFVPVCTRQVKEDLCPH
jgi:hypothetical protein